MPANDFSTDPRCLALWRFEPNALKADSKGNHTLVPNWVGQEIWSHTPGHEGDGEAAFSSYSYPHNCYVANANLAANFPFKTGGMGRVLTFSGYYTFAGPAAYYYRGGSLLCKAPSNYTTGFELSCFYNIGDATGKFRIRVGTGVAQLYETNITIAFDKQIHFDLIIDGDAPSIYFRVRALDTGIISTFIATPPGPILANTDNLRVGTGVYGGLNGFCDEWVIFNRILGIDELDAIYYKTFGLAGPPDNCISITKTQDLPKALTSIKSITLCSDIKLPDPAAAVRSMTSCEDILIPTMDSCKSLTISQGLMKAIPNACISTSMIQQIILDGGDFFLIF
ncbi:MAG: hypothetical protein ACYC6G_17180 [Desulfobaccales bacterium]